MTSTTHNRRARRAAAATAPVEPAVEAAAERAAIERDPAAPADVPVVPVVEGLSADLPATDAAVLPEPTLIAEPDRPAPIVTASPVLAVEPGAMDVVAADAAADRVAAGLEPAAVGEGPHLAAAGQPTLTIEGATAASVAHALADSAPRDFSDVGRDIVEDGDRSHDWDFSAEGGLPNLDDLIEDLRIIMRSDPEACARVLDELLPQRQTVEAATAAPDLTRPTVTVIEVVGPAQGRRRAGMTFGPQPRRFRASDLEEGEIAALRADRLLTVGVTEIDAAEAALAFPDVAVDPLPVTVG